MRPNLPLFVVGKATGLAARDAGFANVIGEGSGDAVRLAPIILSHFEKSDDLANVRLLFPGAATKIGGLAAKIAPISVVDVPVYQTAGRSADDISKELARIPAPCDFVVFFSPSGVAAAMDLVRKHSPDAQLIAIGPTTAKFLPNSLISKTPDAAGVFEHVPKV